MDSSRRAFLGAIGQVTIGTAASVAGAKSALASTSPASEAENQTGPHWGMLVDLRKCIGCQACTVACIMENAVPEDAFRTHVSVYEIVKEGRDPAMVMLPRLCNHCDEPPCVEVCPVEATYKQEGTGEVLIDASRCVGCAYCVQACPYDARFINHDTQTADKCTFCFHRTQAGLLPACVETCVGGARIFGDLNDPESEVSRLLASNEVSVLRPEMHTAPNVYYIGLDEALDGRVAGEAAYHPPLTTSPDHHEEGPVMQIHELVGAVHDAAWLPWAVQYFFLIGMSTTALFMTLPAFVLGRSSCLPHARLALITAVTTGISGPLALLADLHQPSRFWEFFVYTHKTSWMAWGSWIVMCYVTLLVLYTWAVNRPALYRWGQDDWRFAWLFRFLAFGSPENGFVRLIGVATGVAALGILTYTGMEVSIVYSRPLWHTPLLPFQFAATGAVGALGVMLVLGRLLSTGSKVEARMNKMLAVCLAVVALLGAVWFVVALSGISPSHTEALASVAGFPVWQRIAIWATAAIIIPFIIALLAPARSGWITGLIAIHAAWMFRWTVFMGGQAVPKVGSGLYDALMPTGLEGLMGVIGTLGLWFFLLILYTTFVPWAEASLPEDTSAPSPAQPARTV